MTPRIRPPIQGHVERYISFQVKMPIRDAPVTCYAPAPSQPQSRRLDHLSHLRVEIGHRRVPGAASMSSQVILAPNRNVWRIGRAERGAILIDGASYFGALREALIKARSTVFFVGWDLDSRTRLVGERGSADDRYPEDFIDFLTALVNERPHLTV